MFNLWIHKCSFFSSCEGLTCSSMWLKWNTTPWFWSRWIPREKVSSLSHSFSFMIPLATSLVKPWRWPLIRLFRGWTVLPIYHLSWDSLHSAIEIFLKLKGFLLQEKSYTVQAYNKQYNKHKIKQFNERWSNYVFLL